MKVLRSGIDLGVSNAARYIGIFSQIPIFINLWAATRTPFEVPEANVVHMSALDVAGSTASATSGFSFKYRSFVEFRRQLNAI